MVTPKRGDLFSSQAQTLVNTVNCVGIMGAGVALEFKKRLRAMHEDYVRRCSRSLVRLGQPYIFKDLVGPWVLNFPTKQHWRSVSNLDDIVAGLEYLKAHYKEWGVRSLAVPPLGCGQGGLDWSVVGPTLYRHLSELDIPIELYAPHDAPDEQVTEEFLAGGAGASAGTSRLNPAWMCLADIVNRINHERYHWPVGRVLFQKIAYFATAAGLPTDLSYGRASYGPFAVGLKKVTTGLVNNGVLRETVAGKGFVYTLGPTFHQALQAAEPEIEDWYPAIDRVTDLMLRMSSRQAEVAATVHFAAGELRRKRDQVNEMDVLEEVRDWKRNRNPPIHDDEVAASIRALNLLGWLDVAPSDSMELPARMQC